MPILATVNTLIVNHAISRDASSFRTADHALLRRRRYQVSKRNNIAATAKRRVVFILTTRESIDSRVMGMAASYCLLFKFASAHSGGVPR